MDIHAMSEDLELEKDGGRTDYWAPCSALDRDPADPGVEYTIAEGYTCRVYVNDWVDLNTEIIPADDPLWGGSRQVLECQPDYIVVRMWDQTTDLYQPVAVSPEVVWDNYMHEPKTLVE